MTWRKERLESAARVLGVERRRALPGNGGKAWVQGSHMTWPAQEWRAIMGTRNHAIDRRGQAASRGGGVGGLLCHWEASASSVP